MSFTGTIAAALDFKQGLEGREPSGSDDALDVLRIGVAHTASLCAGDVYVLCAVRSRG